MWKWSAFKKSFYELLGEHSQHPDEQDSIQLGYGYAHQFSSTPILDKWVEEIDELLGFVDRYMPSVKVHDFSIKLRNIRLFTFDEYLLLFQLTPSKELYQNTQGAFRYLFIQSEKSHHFFTTHFTADEEGYFKLLHLLGVPYVDYFFRPLPIPTNVSAFYQNAYITGASGVGKSELLKNLFYQFIKRKNTSLVLIDPHGDLCTDLLNLQIIQKHKERVVYFDPYLSSSHTPTINPFHTQDKSEENIDLLTQELVGVFKEIIPNALSLQMEAILTPCIATLLRTEKGNLAELQRFMNDEENKDLLNLGLQSPNPSHQSFFRTSFFKKEYSITKTSIYTRIQALLNHSTFYHLLNGKSTINIAKAINSNKIILIPLSQGKMGAEIAGVYGKFLIAQITSIALRRAKQPPEYRQRTFLFVDEFQNVLTNSIEKIITETRKYKLHLIMANQNLAQIESTKLKNIILGNTHVKMVGSNSPTTLSVFAKEMNMKLSKLQELQNYQFYIQKGNLKPFLIRIHNHLSNRSYQLLKEDKEALKKYMLNSGQYREKTSQTNTSIIPEKLNQEERQEQIDKENKNYQNTENTVNNGKPQKPVKPKFDFNDENEPS